MNYKMEWVIIIGICWMALVAISNFYGYNPGTKGLREKPYITKSGEKHTADKSREEHIL